jgi:hypothetical protein
MGCNCYKPTPQAIPSVASPRLREMPRDDYDAIAAQITVDWQAVVRRLRLLTSGSKPPKSPPRWKRRSGPAPGRARPPVRRNVRAEGLNPPGAKIGREPRPNWNAPCLPNGMLTLLPVAAFTIGLAEWLTGDRSERSRLLYRSAFVIGAAGAVPKVLLF